MENIFNKHGIPTYFFNFSLYISDNLLFYLYDNLYHENIDTLTRGLKTELKINANGKYI
jgi:hypothetical protein